MFQRKHLLFIGLATVMGCGDDGNDGGQPQQPDARPAGANEILVSAEISQDETWTSDKTYILTDKIFVTGGATLTIEAGTQILGEGDSALVITREGKIRAEGTETNPIVFSARADAGTRVPGSWAGLALLGRATINIGTDAGGFFEKSIEGIPPEDGRGIYGGDDDAHDCGTLKYVRIEFAGAELTVGDELNGLTLGACGSGTTIDYVQVHQGKDDGIEFFGGTVNVKHVVVSDALDDSIDWDEGFRGKVQFLLVRQSGDAADNGFEADNNGDALDAEPRSAPLFYNVTMVGTTTSRGMRLREGTWGKFYNVVMMNFGVAAVDVNDAETAAGTMDSSLTIENSLFFNIGTGGSAYFEEEMGESDDDGGFDESVFFTAAERNNMFGMDPLLGDPAGVDFAPGAESPVATAGAAPPAGDAFFDQTDYIGALPPGGPDWTSGWTAFPEN